MLLADLLPASFRNARFKVPSDELEEGRNNVEHLYPDSSMRYLEDNGLIPPSFSLTAVLHGPDLPGQLAALRSALTKPGPGVLKHPVYGSQFVGVDGAYKVKREDRDAGVVTLDIRFKVTGPPIFPGLVTGIAAVVTGLAAAAVTAAYQAFVRLYGAPTLGAVSRETIATAIEEIATALDSHFGATTSAASRLAGQPALWLATPETLSDLFVEALRAPFDAVDTRAVLGPPTDDDPVTLSATDLLRGFKAALEVTSAQADLALTIVATTPDLTARKASLALLAELTESAIFVSMAEAMAGRDYRTAEEVETDEVLLVDTFATLQSRGLPAEIHTRCAEVMVATLDVLRDQAVRLPRLTALDPHGTPASVLAYSIYESDENLWEIIDLNVDQDPALLVREATVLMQEV